MDAKKWIPIPPLPHTTFPTLIFSFYIFLTFILSPIYIPLMLVQHLFQWVMYCINYLFYAGINGTLTAIEESGDNYVVITGAASGIGKEMTLLYAIRGFSLILIDINQDVQELAASLKKNYPKQHFRSIVSDLAQDTAAQDIYDQITGLPSDDDADSNNDEIPQWGIENVVILVNNAGFGMTGVFLNQSIKGITKMCKVNCFACIQLAHLFGRHFVKRGKGRICQIASIAAYTPGPLAAAYHGTKSFVRAWALSFQHELLGTGVGMTVVCPAAVKTNFANTSSSNLSNVFTTFSFMAYTPLQVATAAVDATLSGKREVFVGALARNMHYILSFYGEAYNVIAGRYLWANPSSQSRNPYQKFKYSN